jgi:hypothetical protein
MWWGNDQEFPTLLPRLDNTETWDRAGEEEIGRGALLLTQVTGPWKEREGHLLTEFTGPLIIT